MKWHRHIISITGIGLLLLLCSGFPKKKVTERRVLFIGDQMTNAHAMTNTLQQMLDEQHISVKVTERAEYGLSLGDHLYMVKRGVYWSNATNGEIPTSIKAIGNGPWEMVVLQESPDDILVPEFRKYAAEPAVRYLDSIVKRAKSKTVLFQACADGKYPNKHCKNGIHLYYTDDYPLPRPADLNTQKDYCSENYTSAAEEYKVIQQVYNNMAEKTKAAIAPVGAAFGLCKSKHPEIELYEGTEKPSEQGSYLMACIFYRYIAKRKLTGVKYCAGVNATEAKQLRDVADAVVM